MDRHMLFDDKLTLDDEYKYDGVKNGPIWKVKLENYFMGKAAVMQEILTWAEAETEAISEETFVYALSMKMDDQQAMAVNSSLWGFLAGRGRRRGQGEGLPPPSRGQSHAAGARRGARARGAPCRS